LTTDKFYQQLLAVQQALCLVQERRIILMRGSRQWFYDVLQPVLLTADSRVLCVSTAKQAAEQVTVQRYRNHLGRECDWLLFDEPYFDIDAFAALSGCLVAGGLLIIRVDHFPLTEPVAASHFFSRFYRQLEAEQWLLQLSQQGEDLSSQLHQQCHQLVQQTTTHIQPTVSNDVLMGCTTEQQTAIQHIEHVLRGHRNRPLVLTADRGRGKSSALAIACARLFIHSNQPLLIVITAPSNSSLTIFFQQLAACLPNGEWQTNQFSYQQHQVLVKPIDQLLQTPKRERFNLLLVDEAAGFPVPMLMSLVTHFHRVVFSSTVHGYEGAGRGFSLKFLTALKARCPDVRALHIQQPIRWSASDPLEQFVFNSSLLNAELPSSTTVLAERSAWQIAIVTSQQLVADEALLTSIFAILVTAHYQTTPSDLQLLLDNAQCQVVVVYQHQLMAKNLLAVALVMTEGDLSASSQIELVRAIGQGTRRIRDHFLPQALLTHCGFESAFDYRYYRILRIAVIPHYQAQGIGSYLLNELVTLARHNHIDIIGSSFALNNSLWSFWRQQQFSIARLGFTKDQASGEHSALMLRVIQPDLQVHITQLEQQFYRSFSYLLTDEFNALPAELVAQILADCPVDSLPEFTEYDRQTVVAFANKKRLYSQSVYALQLWLRQHIQAQIHVEQTSFPMICRVLQKHSIADVCQQFQLTGKKALQQYLVEFVASALANS